MKNFLILIKYIIFLLFNNGYVKVFLNKNEKNYIFFKHDFNT